MMDVATFNEHRPLLFSIAYRMLGSASDAEDVVQDAWVRFQGAGDVRQPRALAATIVTRLCLDRLKSARATREEYVGPWLPEPILTTEEGPEAMLQRSESVTLAFLLLLEALSPEERAVFILKEAFDYDHKEIGEILEISPDNSRQLLHRAKEKLRAGRPRAAETRMAPAERMAIASRFAAAFKTGDAAALTALLASDVHMVSDGGGKVSAARRPLAGREEVLHFLLGLHRLAKATGIDASASLALDEVNGEPAICLRINNELDGVFVASVEDGRIAALRVVRNPDKLAFLARQLSARGVKAGVH